MSDRTQTKPGQMEELKVTGNLMTLQPGLYCLVQHMGTVPPPQDGSGLPGIRVSVAPRGRAGGSGQVSIRGLHEDGWLGMRDGAALVRVEGGAAEILVTVYQSPNHPTDAAPRLQVVPITNTGPKAGSGAATAAQPASRAPVAPAPAPDPAPRAAPGAAPGAAMSVAAGELVAHVQRTGDVGVALGEWIGTRGSGKWIEGFSISPNARVTADEIEYQAVLGRGWLSPWVSDGKFCGSRGMSLPLLGLNLRLRGGAVGRFACTYSATFVDGTRIGPVPAGQTLEAPSLAPLEAFQITMRPLGAVPAAPSPQRAMREAPGSRPPARKVATKKTVLAKTSPSKKSPAKKSPAKESRAKSPSPTRKRGR